MGQRLHKTDVFLHRYGFYALLHIVILLLSIYLVVCISIDTFHNLAFYKQPEFLTIQFWICVVFLSDFFLEFILAEKKRHYLLTHAVFFIVSIPYLWIFQHYNLHFSKQLEYVLQFIPLVRGGYAMAIVVGWFTSNRATSLLLSYLITLLSTVYFSSLAFYLFEHHHNSLVKTYSDALWWASMDVTTVGSNIVAVTPVGRVLSVLLAALGMMMFPIFTVYVTNLIKHKNEDHDSIMALTAAAENMANDPEVKAAMEEAAAKQIADNTTKNNQQSK